MGLEERLARIERLLAEVLERLERLERALPAGDEARIAAEMVLAAGVPAQQALKAARQVVRLLGTTGGGDDLTRAIVEALALQGPLSLRGLERAVRRIRGRASRIKIRERLEKLEQLGIVVVERRGTRMVVRLAEEG